MTQETAMVILIKEVSVAQSCPTLRPHGLQPTSLLHPWNSPGQNTGVGSHCFLHLIKRKHC